MIPGYFKSPLTQGFLLISFSLSTITTRMILKQMLSILAYKIKMHDNAKNDKEPSCNWQGENRH